MNTEKPQKSIFASPGGGSYLFPFILVTSLFALWGFANDITNPMVAAFKNVLLISNSESALVQTAFYGGYCIMAIPAALFIRKFNYKNGILAGLALYAIGCLLFIPACNAMAFWAFLIAYFVMTCGLSFLETTSNPYILALGPEESSTRRLNFSQAFNPIGSLTGMFIASNVILKKIEANDANALAVLQSKSAEAAAAIDTSKPFAEEVRRSLQSIDASALMEVRKADLDFISGPYLILGLVVLAFLILFFVTRLPKITLAEEKTYSLGQTVKILFKNKRYIWSVVAQAFYVGVQIMVWTFIIQYADREMGMPKSIAQNYNIVAMAIFVTSRFICTFLLKYFKPSRLLATLAIFGGLFVIGAIFLPNAQFVSGHYLGGYWGLYCLMAVSACMSLMFPTIYGIALQGMGDEAKLASSGLILAIGGGSILPWVQGKLIDRADWFGQSLSSVRFSFVLSLICFIVIALFARWVGRSNKNSI
ncbi:MAG: L-fucose:H+ symporter permease [Dysgonamonadaceae bacterium]|jgi:FHS family L-fucose permease-like MFS transporter|nr:L-fucose:H+ symporter permease [Dysgonamonadaceae bacterium]